MEKDRKVFIAKAGLGTIVLSLYIGASLFFKDTFYFGTTLGDLKIGGKTTTQVQQAIEQKGQAYVLSLHGRNAEKQTLSGETFELSYDIGESLEDLKKRQPAFAWPLGLFSKKDLEVAQTVSYDEALLMKAINQLEYFNEETRVAPENATLVFNGSSFDIIPGDKGNKLNKEAVKAAVIEALHENKHVIDLEESGCYETAKFTEDSSEVLVAKEKFDQYVKANITYNFGEVQEVVDAELISTWLELTEEGEAIINKKKVRRYIAELGKKYDTLGITRAFKTSEGTIAKVHGGDYGFQISVSSNSEALIAAIKEGQVTGREPIPTLYTQSYNSEDIGSSYVEISLTKQYLWFYKDGKLITEGSIVTGDKKRNYSTPQGTYKLKYKQRNATLTGEDYAAPVNYWMPFNGDIGIHDATWRSAFGGDIYVSNGSHGCVNAPYNVAQAIFNNIEVGIPIICYY